HDITDVLDFRFFETNTHLTVVFEKADGRRLEEKIIKSQYGSLGLEFETYLMDKQRSCRNKCVFCFIDQLPKGMRETLYFKDDDARLSFLFGNYITLTNIDDREIDRILQMHISPINISVHTMNPKLRCEMMQNRFAGDALRHLRRLAENNIRLNCQIVLCPGLNDGEELEFTLSELYKLGECLQSVACVPVGLTRYREGLYPLQPFNAESAENAIEILERWGDKFKGERGTRTVFPSDEFYLIAGRELPSYEFYEDFPQIENGVGMLRDFEEEFLWALDETEGRAMHRRVTIPTGTAAYPFLNKVFDALREKFPGLEINLVPVKNEFFGGTVDVTGLLVGQDVLRRLKTENLGDEVLIPTNMLMANEPIFLDDMTLDQLSDALGVPVRRIQKDAAGQLRDMLGEPCGDE
ncbi:MAG: DUF512 domain-containing protein, partial [Clostridia bacterium]|nr:DUF512 domain-containing protein [Clostridia bacterium]